ncbi:MAG: hypothetical protein ACI9UN_002845, partial [Granulosicoccus sp.]
KLEHPNRFGKVTAHFAKSHFSGPMNGKFSKFIVF